MSTFTILNHQPQLEHERFSAHRQLESHLKAALRGDVLFDLGSRALYAADSSNYRQLPIGVVYPRDTADVEAAIAACRAVGAAILPRGAGTSLAGQCVNVAVVFDFSRYMNALGSIDPGAKLATVQPGIVLDRLRDAAEVHHLTFAPDPATHSRCTLGGIIGNNSCGVHGLLGGKAVDNVQSLDIVLYDGTRLTVGPTTNEQLASLIRQGGRIGEIYAGLDRIRQQYSSEIRKKFPNIPRRVSGYNLDELLPEGNFNVARALVGSEGTCATIVSATLNLAASPPYRVLTALGFTDPFLAADAVPAALEHGPIGLEGFDSLLIDFMHRKGLAEGDITLLPPGRGYLLVEMGAWDAAEAQAKAEALVRASQSWPTVPEARIYTNAADAARVWHVRESALGATVFVPGEPDGWEGWEDAGVPPARLGDYLRKLTALMAEYGYRTPLYGHYGQGCVHMRINFDFRTEPGVLAFREFIDRAADLVLSYGGSLSGEHGDGQARAALLPKMFGPELMQAFREFKALWDPDNRMNPGKLMDAVRVYDPTENLRHSPSVYAHQHEGERALAGAPSNGSGAHQGGGHIGWEPNFAFSRDEGSFARATERCVGVGACRKTTGGVMCPSYRATGEEQHSTRGRARLLWEMLNGSLQVDGFQSESVHKALDLCLSCKACKTECPVQVDMASWKSEFLAQHYKGRLHPLRHYVFGFADKLARLGSIAPGLTNAILTGPVSPLVKRTLGIAQGRELPRLATESYQKSRTSASHPAGKIPGRPVLGAPGPGSVTRESTKANEPQPVLVWPDTWNNYYHPATLHAAEKVLATAGFAVSTPRKPVCCGRPLYDFGFLGAAKKYLGNVLNQLAPEIEAGTPLIFLEPSCASVFTDELPELFPDDPRAQQLRSQVHLLADWLAANAPDFAKDTLTGAQILIHGHCHHKADFGGPASELAILRNAGADVQMIQAGCCGMAGPFGFEADKFEVSKKIAEDGLLPAVRSAGPTTILVSDGFSCREQIHQLGHAQALHFAEVLARTCGCGG
ncbi:MAG TPA: FAD-binding and (Fe-S)-binding domain-containing protein [Terracidiphilus sp.]|nr:FAD-binding and (Fe-S)-binding domain-containing protein [Terracidiphilus sp.]